MVIDWYWSWATIRYRFLGQRNIPVINQSKYSFLIMAIVLWYWIQDPIPSYCILSVSGQNNWRFLVLVHSVTVALKIINIDCGIVCLCRSFFQTSGITSSLPGYSIMPGACKPIEFQWKAGTWAKGIWGLPGARNAGLYFTVKSRPLICLLVLIRTLGMPY